MHLKLCLVYVPTHIGITIVAAPPLPFSKRPSAESCCLARHHQLAQLTSTAPIGPLSLHGFCPRGPPAAFRERHRPHCTGLQALTLRAKESQSAITTPLGGLQLSPNTPGPSILKLVSWSSFVKLQQLVLHANQCNIGHTDRALPQEGEYENNWELLQQ